MNADLARAVGFDMLWDDAGWSSYDGMPPDNYGSVFTPTYEGPDFRQTRRYLEKMGMGWLAWFAGRPTPGVMAGKVGAWGDFEWRTDAVDFPDFEADRDLRDKIVRFLDRFPRSSFHTCSGGSSTATPPRSNGSPTRTTSPTSAAAHSPTTISPTSSRPTSGSTSSSPSLTAASTSPRPPARR